MVSVRFKAQQHVQSNSCMQQSCSCQKSFRIAATALGLSCSLWSLVMITCKHEEEGGSKVADTRPGGLLTLTTHFRCHRHKAWLIWLVPIVIVDLGLTDTLMYYLRVLVRPRALMTRLTRRLALCMEQD